MDLNIHVEHVGGSPEPPPTLTERLLALHDETHDVAAADPDALGALTKEIGGLWIAIAMIGETIDGLPKH